MTDNVMILRNTLEGEKRRRIMEILKFRGTDHQKGEYPFTIIPGQGIEVIPLSAMQLQQRSTDKRVFCGTERLDKMCSGGFFRDSIILASGAIGTGKTLLATEFVIGLTSFVKKKTITGLFTSTTPQLLGGTSITETHISTITDSIILLRYVELGGEMRRGLTVLKMRGSYHDKNINEYTIDHEGMHLGRAFRNVSGILSGSPVQVSLDELGRMDNMFQGE